MDRIARRYAPMSRDHIPGFPNKMTKVDWSKNFLVFRNMEGNDAALHLVKFHIHVHKLNIDFPKDCLMKVFMATLEDEARSWYESLPSDPIYCLKDFHTMFFEKYKESYPSLILVQNCCSHVHSFIENLENFYGDNELMDGEIMEALYENPFQQHEENLEDSHQHAQETLQADQDLSTMGTDEREGSISDLSIEEDSMQGNQVSISECDKVKSAISDLNLDRDDQDYLVLNPIKESSAVEIIWYEEDKVIDQSLHEEVIQSFHEKQDEIFVQVSEKSSFNNSVVNHNFDSLIAMSYEDDQQCFQVSEDQDCHSDFPCFEMLFQEDKTCLSKRKQKVISPLSEDEIDQLLKGHVTAQAKANPQCAHGQEGDGETSSSVENDDSLVISFIDQQTYNIFFHEDDKAIMFDDLEDCFLFKNDLDHEVEEYKLERDNMSKFLMVKEFIANTHMAEAYTSMCLPIN